MPIERIDPIRAVAAGERLLRPLFARSGLPPGRAAALIDAKIAALGDWRGEALNHLRRLIREATPELLEDWQWGGPVWCASGVVCALEFQPAALRLSFAQGASLPDPTGLFSAGQPGSRRSLLLRQGQLPDTAALQSLLRAALARDQAARP